MLRSSRSLLFVLAVVGAVSIAACEDKSSAPAPSMAPAPAGSVGGSIDFEGKDLAFVRVFTDSPAAKAGIRPHDRILRIDGVATDAMTIGQAKDAFRGPAGSSLTLTVATGTQPQRAVTIVREVVTNKTPLPDTPVAPPPAAGAPAAAPPPVPAPAPAKP